LSVRGRSLKKLFFRRDKDLAFFIGFILFFLFFPFFLYLSLPLLPPEAREAPVGELGVQVKEGLKQVEAVL
jgi:hypothetical protein